MAHGRRVIGRILSLGFPLPGPQVDNYNFVSAPAFFDYDALVVDPAAFGEMVESLTGGGAEAVTFAGRAVRNAPATARTASLADVLLRRREETRAALDNGAVIVCFAHAAGVHRSVAGIDALDDYFWLPRPEGVTLAPPQLVACDGSRVRVVDYGHPLAGFVSGQLANLAYRAHFDVARMPAMSGGRVFARSEGGAAVGVELPCEVGRIIFVPALARVPAGDDRYAMSEALQAGIRRALGVLAEGRPPPWLREYKLAGLDERAEARDQARRAVEAAQASLEEAERAHEEIARYQRLLWQEGAVGLDEVVVEALALLGFDAYTRERDALELRDGDTRVLLEIEASERAIDMTPHHRLRQRIERAIERTGAPPRGLLIVNGFRLNPPAERPQQVTDALRTAAETMGYGIATTASLYEAVRAKIDGDDLAVDAYRERVTTTDGLIA